MSRGLGRECCDAAVGNTETGSPIYEGSSNIARLNTVVLSVLFYGLRWAER